MNRTILTVGLALMLSLSAVGVSAKEESIVKADKAEISGLVPMNANCSLGAGTFPLADGVATSASLPATVGSSCEFSFAPIAGTTSSKVTLPATTPADFDLYVKRGSPPTTASYDCRPYLGGSSIETCTVANNAATVYVMVLRYSGSGAFSVTAVGITPPPTCSLGSGTTSLSNAVSQAASVTADVGANCQFSYVPGAGADVVGVVLSGLATDLDLYVKVGSAPTTSSFDCRPFSGGTASESCNVENSGATVFAMVRRYGSGTGTFTVTATDIVVPTLENGVPVSGSSATGSQTFFKLIVPEGSVLANFVLAGDPSGAACGLDPAAPCAPDVDLYVKAASLPSLTSFTCRPWVYGSVESCTFQDDAHAAAGDIGGAIGANTGVPSPAHNYALSPGKYFVMVHGYAGPADWVLQGATA